MIKKEKSILESMNVSSNLQTKSQSAIEFIVVVSIVLVFFILILIVLSQQTETIGFQGNSQYATMLSTTIENEIQLAKTIDGTYSRTFMLPEEIDGNFFTFELFRGRELRITDESGQTTLSFLTGFVCGNVSPGVNEIIKKESTIGICPGSCNNILPCVSTGEIQCAKQENAWATCNPSFGDVYEQMRVYCPNVGDEGFLNITNVDDGYTMYSASAITSPDYALFEDDFTINESGDYLFEVDCVSGGVPMSYAREYFVPYGAFVVQPLRVSGCDEVNSTAYNCTADSNFTILSEIYCEGGECGDATIWLDPQ